MNILTKLSDSVARLRTMAPLSKARYACIALATGGLIWIGVALAGARDQEGRLRARSAGLRQTVSDLRLQISRQRTVAPAPIPVQENDASPEGVVAAVGAAATQAGMQLAQSRIVASPPSAQPAAAAAVPAAAAPAQPAPGHAPAAVVVDPGAVEFHLTGSYAALQQMLGSLAKSQSHFQIVTLDILRAKAAAGSGAAQLDVRLVCLL